VKVPGQAARMKRYRVISVRTMDDVEFAQWAKSVGVPTPEGLHSLSLSLTVDGREEQIEIQEVAR
jgi:hypothetical protein